MTRIRPWCARAALVALALLVPVTLAAQTANPFTAAEIQQMLDAHNTVRSAVNPPAQTMPNLTWDPLLAQVAQNYTDQCTFAHNANRSIDYANLGGSGYVGENIYATSTSPVGPQAPVDSWASEVADWTYAPFGSDCASGAICGHYTQIIWANTLRVGCGRTTCSSGITNLPFSGDVVVCDYAPGGNFPGRVSVRGADRRRQPAAGRRCRPRPRRARRRERHARRIGQRRSRGLDVDVPLDPDRGPERHFEPLGPRAPDLHGPRRGLVGPGPDLLARRQRRLAVEPARHRRRDRVPGLRRARTARAAGTARTSRAAGRARPGRTGGAAGPDRRAGPCWAAGAGRSAGAHRTAGPGRPGGSGRAAGCSSARCR